MTYNTDKAERFLRIEYSSYYYNEACLSANALIKALIDMGASNISKITSPVLTKSQLTPLARNALGARVTTPDFRLADIIANENKIEIWDGATRHDNLPVFFDPSSGIWESTVEGEDAPLTLLKEAFQKAGPAASFKHWSP